MLCRNWQTSRRSCRAPAMIVELESREECLLKGRSHVILEIGQMVTRSAQCEEKSP